MFIHSPRELAIFIKAQRKKLNLSQQEVGNLVGLKQKTISAIENDCENIKLSTLFRILSALEIDIKFIAKKDATEITSQWKEEW
ncbi:DNA-binding transcriptional regulator [Legionella busanensis]|uniref:DNA-binding transcriptional regulator n=1 Tax=Legionella busanensis TaxID=190655 RepID=A0A378JL20_9GAMM|nr:helix-turn-helix domain-containing protein [Legionella busanensis]STX51013.1 DNA-binding transcriptional regulator [Legionella busanensis]